MRSIVLDRFGGPDVLREADMGCPTPADDEVLVRVLYAGVNPVDWKIREGVLKDRLPHRFPLIPGWDVTGVVEAAGAHVTEFQGGEAVFAYCRKPVVQWGTYAEYVAVDAKEAALKPPDLPFAQAAGVPLAGLTAWQSLFDHAELRSGQVVLIHAGAGGVGSHAIQFARQAGATVLTTASPHNHEYVRDLGAQTAIDYNTEDFVECTRDTHPDGIDVIFDTIGGATQQRSYQVLKQGGALVSIAHPPTPAQAERHGVRGLYCFVEPNGLQLRDIAKLLASSAIRPGHTEALALEQAVEAQERSKAGHVCGKLVLRVCQDGAAEGEAHG